MTESLFLPDGDGYLPTDLALGPWDPNALHGGAPSALMAGAIESFAGAEMFVARMTVEFLRPVPKAHLALTTSLLRPGRKVQLVGASIAADGTEVARATGLRLRQAPVPIPPHQGPDLSVPGFPSEPGDLSGGLSLNKTMASAMEIRYVSGHFAVPARPPPGFASASRWWPGRLPAPCSE